MKSMTRFCSFLLKTFVCSSKPSKILTGWLSMWSKQKKSFCLLIIRSRAFSFSSRDVKHLLDIFEAPTTEYYLRSFFAFACKEFYKHVLTLYLQTRISLFCAHHFPIHLMISSLKIIGHFSILPLTKCLLKWIKKTIITCEMRKLLSYNQNYAQR